MTLDDLRAKIHDYVIHALTRTRKMCEIEGCPNKAAFYIEWEFPHYRDYFCAEHKQKAEVPA